MGGNYVSLRDFSRAVYETRYGSLRVGSVTSNAPAAAASGGAPPVLLSDMTIVHHGPCVADFGLRESHEVAHDDDEDSEKDLAAVAREAVFADDSPSKSELSMFNFPKVYMEIERVLRTEEDGKSVTMAVGNEWMTNNVEQTLSQIGGVSLVPEVLRCWSLF